MKQVLKRLFFLGVFFLSMAGFSTNADAKVVKGSLVELSSVDSWITLEVEAPSGGKQYVTYKVAKDARWHICLVKNCINKKGVEGFRTVNEYARYAEYGIPHRSYHVTVEAEGDTVNALEVQIIEKVH